jgi:hypothetical protein
MGITGIDLEVGREAMLARQGSDEGCNLAHGEADFGALRFTCVAKIRSIAGLADADIEGSSGRLVNAGTGSMLYLLFPLLASRIDTRSIVLRPNPHS